MDDTALRATLLRRLSYDADTGLFSRRSNGGRGARSDLCGLPVGSAHKDGYLAVQVGPKKYLAHRLAWLYVFGLFPPNEIDHRNGIRTDNRIANLRVATKPENQQNRALRNGRLGIDYHKGRGRWRARITVAGVVHCLGYFTEQDAAQAAYLRAKKLLHPGACRA
jgi:hypothetical protein